MNDTQFIDFAISIGRALQRDRQTEDRLRGAGLCEEANAIYLRNKAMALQIFQTGGMTTRQFDKRLAKLAPGRLNVRLERVFHTLAA